MSDADEVLGALREEASDIEAWVLRRPWLNAGYMLSTIATTIEYGAKNHFDEIQLGGYYVRAVRAHIDVNEGGPVGELLDVQVLESKRMTSGDDRDSELQLRIPIAAATAVVAALRSKAANRS